LEGNSPSVDIIIIIVTFIIIDNITATINTSRTSTLSSSSSSSNLLVAATVGPPLCAEGQENPGPSPTGFPWACSGLTFTAFSNSRKTVFGLNVLTKHVLSDNNSNLLIFM
jgi:hypothetical protein